MAGELINTSGIFSGATNAVSGVLSQTLSPLMGILKAVGIVFLIYIVILIIKAIMEMRTGSRIKKIADNVEEINQKLDKIVKKKK